MQTNYSEKTAQKLTDLLVRLKKDRTHVPYVVEVTGMPKSGKTTIIRRLRNVLEHHGLSVHVIEEAATVKVDKKYRSDLFVFNILCAMEHLSSLLKTVHCRGIYDVVLMDRGLFDSVVWTSFLNRSGLLNEYMEKMISDFFLAKQWFSQIDLVVNIGVNRLTYAERTRLGSAIPVDPRFNEDYFKRLKEAYKTAADRLQRVPAEVRPKFYSYDTTVVTATDATLGDPSYSERILVESSNKYSFIARELCDLIANGMDDKCTEKIAVIDRDVIESAIYFGESVNEKMEPWRIKQFINTIFARRSADSLEAQLAADSKAQVRYMLRSKAETDSTVIQLVAAAYLVREGKVMVLKRSDKEHRNQLRGKRSVLVSGHVDSKDQALASGGSNELENCLLREMSEELTHFDRPFVTPRFAFRMGDQEMGMRHFSIIYEVETNSSRVNVSALPGAGDYDQLVEWLTVSDLVTRKDEFDDWSHAVIDRLVREGLRNQNL